MVQFNYDSCDLTIREDLPKSYRQVWDTVGKAGNWWSAQDRVAIAQESRNARICKLCTTRKTALSPYGDDGHHDSTTNLPAGAVDAVHRITTDPARIKREWVHDLSESGITDAHYVELLGIVVAVISIDAFNRAIGMSPEPLPEPAEGAPDQYRPPGAKDQGAFVDMVAPADLTEPEADLYGGSPQTGNVLAAMSLVPESVRMLTTLSGTQYLTAQDVPDPTTNGGRALTRSQIELTAGRVSSLSDCFY